MTLFFYILIGLITFVAFLHTWAKKDYDISRTIIINKPKAEVFGYVRQLRNERFWYPWLEKHPKIQLKYKGEDGKLNATMYWQAPMKIGKQEGIQKITKVKNGKVLETQLLFLKPYKTLAHTYMAVKEVTPERTKIVWGVRGVHRFPASVIMLFYRLPQELGEQLEEGLENLRYILDS